MTESRAAATLPWCEWLEPRRLLAGEPWGVFPELIGQAQAAEDYPDLTGAGQTIAIIDTGIAYQHPSLGGGLGQGFRIIDGWDFVDEDDEPLDGTGHGTGVAGMAAASPFVVNGLRYQGIAPEANLVALRVDDGTGRLALEPRLERALRWVIDRREQYNIVAVNISWGYSHFSTEARRASYADELARLHEQGVFIAASSGNNGVYQPYGIEYPGADPSVISVGGVDRQDVIYAPTERGPNLDLLAPADRVSTTYFDPKTGRHLLIDYGKGTSFSAPVAAGLAAVLKQINGDFTVPEMLAIMRDSGAPNYDGDDESTPVTHLTFPRIDVYAAITLAINRLNLRQPPPVGARSSHTAMAFDSRGALHLAAYDSQQRYLKYARRERDGTWSGVQVIDSFSPDVGQYVSLAIDHNDRPAVAYFNAAGSDLKYAEWDGQNWRTATVDARKSVGLYPSLAFDWLNRPAVAYYYKTGGDLRLARRDGSTWRITTIDAGFDAGRFSSLAFSPVNGRWGVAYLNSTHGILRYAEELRGGISRGSVDNLLGNGAYISLAFDANGRPAFSYYDAWLADLKLARWTGRGWDVRTIAAQRAQGAYSRLFFDNYGMARILYYHRSLGTVFLARDTRWGWRFEDQQTGAEGLVIAMGPAGQRSIAFSVTQINGLAVEDLL